MPFDGNGNWTSNFSAVADRDANIKILASRFDGILLADIAQSFENCLTKDMQVKPQQAFNANNYRMINVSDPVDLKDAVNLQTLDGKDALCVHKAGSETITGGKTFSGSTTFSGSVSLGSLATATTQDASDSSTKVATTAWVNTTGNNVVHLTGTETITGAKTFTLGTVFSNTMTRKGSWTAGTTPSANVNNSLNFVDSTGTVYGSVGKFYGTTGIFLTRLTAKRTNGTGEINLSIGYDANGNATTSAPIPTDTTSTSSNKIATTGWVNTVGNSCMHLTGNESAGGTKTFTSVPIILRGSYTGLYNRRSDLEYNVTPDSNITMGGIEFQDKNNTWVGRFATDMYSSGNHITYMQVRGKDNTTNRLAIIRTASGDVYAEFPTPSSATDNSDKGATTKWVRNHRCTTAATTTSSASVDAPAYIVQNYKNGKSWYRVWSDGWIEQGGYKSSSGNVTLLKTMSDTDFSLLVNADDTSNSSIDCSGMINSTSEIKLNIPGDSAGAWWRVSGY